MICYDLSYLPSHSLYLHRSSCWPSYFHLSDNILPVKSWRMSSKRNVTPNQSLELITHLMLCLIVMFSHEPPQQLASHFPLCHCSLTVDGAVLQPARGHAEPERAAGAEDQDDRGQHSAAAGWAASDPGWAAESAGTESAGETQECVAQ